MKSDVLPNTPSLEFFLFLSVVLVSSLVCPFSSISLLDRRTFIYPYREFKKIGSSRTISQDMQIGCCQKAREASINRYVDIKEY